MIAYKKHRRKVDPVKQILARVEERQNKSGLSLYSTTRDDETTREDMLPAVHQVGGKQTVSLPSKNVSFFADLSAARQKAHKRLNAFGSKHVTRESQEKAMQFPYQTNWQLNLTFPLTKPHTIKNNSQGYSFSSWSESSSAGVENLRSSHHTSQSLNPFGYSRRTLAFQPTSLNYVVEWPETWPLKIMSLSKANVHSFKKKPKPKPKEERRVHFKNVPSQLSSQRVLPANSAIYTQGTASEFSQPDTDLARQQKPLPSVLTQPTPTPPPPPREAVEEGENCDFVWGGLEAEALSNDMRIPSLDPSDAEIPRISSDASSVSEMAYTVFATGKDQDEDKQEVVDSSATTNMAVVPPCTPTPDISDGEELGNQQQDSKEDDTNEQDDGNEEKRGTEEEMPKEEEGEENAQARLMDIVSQIAAEGSSDYMQDI